MAEVTVGIDIGTTSVKAVAVTATGEVVARCRIPHELHAPSGRVFEHDAARAWRAGPLEAWSRVAAGHDVVGGTVAAMVPSLCAVDAAGLPLGPGLLYGDGRGGSGVGSPGESGEIVGFARWLAGRHPDAAGFWPAQAVANAALCGVGAIDTSSAMTMMPLFDGQGWSVDVCASAGVSPGQLPVLSPGAAAIGTTPDGARLSGGTIDALAEQFVAAATAVGDALVVCGTTLIPWALVDEWLEVERLWSAPYSRPGVFAVGGASNAGGLFIDRVRAALAPVEDETLLGLDAAEPVPVWLPYLRGERTPLHDRDRRADLLDVELGQGAPELLWAAFEASGFVVRHHFDLAGVRPTRIVAAGGGVRSAPWMQALADATGLPVDVSGVADGAALGAAFVGRMAAGLEDDTANASSWSSVSHRVEPRAPWVEACSARYRRFLEGTDRA